ncbi:hypothetical protein HUB97_09525 [Halorubraceae archaeon YAN]|nr:hypothetical protein [Halorubraceae archaeon YAN]
MVSRRQLLGMSIGGVTLLSGCADFVTGSGPLSVEASPATVPSNTLADTGYEVDREEAQTLREEFAAAGQTREVEATNQLAIYYKQFEVPDVGETETGVFAAVATPAVEIAGQEFNPVAELDHRELIEMFTEQYGEVSNLEQRGTETYTILGESVTASLFTAEAVMEGQSVDIRGQIAVMRNADDFIISAAVSPERIHEQAESSTPQLFESIEHAH